MNFREYATKMLEIKGIKPSSKFMKRATSALRRAYNTVYKAVAFDIDGTLTDLNSTSINNQMAIEIASLLQRGVPILLITGRGRAATKEAVSQILKISGIEPRYAARLHCITHNGLIWLKASTDNPEELLAQEIRLSSNFAVLNEFKNRVLEDAFIKKEFLARFRNRK